MDKIIFLVHFHDMELRTLHRILAMRDAGLIAEARDINTMPLMGKSPDWVVFDELWPPKLDAWIKEHDIKIAPVVAEPTYPHARNRQCKGEKRKNKKFRWSS